MNRVLLIGVDTTKLAGTNVTEYNSEAIRKEAELAAQQLNEIGYQAKWHFADLTADPLQAVADELKSMRYDLVLIGAGIRRRPETLLLFESLVNVVHMHAVAARICFNADVHDTVPAVLRLLPLRTN